jgi:stearoyl-CoA desaturase (delta-9 desaturase)
MRLALSLCTATSYVYAYGPLCAVTKTALVTPATTLWSFANMVRGGLLGPYYLGVLVAGTLAFHFGYQLIISTLLHRYFSHRAFATSRPLNALLALVAVAAGQRGPLWWASTHRRHHRLCDRDGDPHSPVAVPPEHAALPWFHSHLLWMTRRENFAIQADNVGDWLQRTPELLALELFFLDASGYLDAAWQLAFKRLGQLSWRWASFALTLKLARVLGHSLAWHVTFGVNSLCHDAKEEDKGLPVGRSRNLAWLEVLSCGDAYHATHHAAARDARHAPPGRTDLAHAVMRGAARLGLIALPHAKGE